MKTIAIFGMSGLTGREVISEALSRGYAVQGLVRNPEKFSIDQGTVNIIQGDVFNITDVKKTLAGADAVIVTLGVRSNANTMVQTKGTENIIQAMKEANIKRLIVMGSYMMSGDTASMRGIVKAMGMFVKFLVKNIVLDKQGQEKVTIASDLDWTIVRPSVLTNLTKTGTYRKGVDIPITISSKIARADVADYFLSILENSDTFRKIELVSRS